MKGKIHSIYSTSEAGQALNAYSTVKLEAGAGIVGDRYYKSVGTFSDALKESGDFQLTLIELEAIETFNKVSGLNYSPEKFRRNLITTGVRLNELVGQEFTIGSCKIIGVRLCEPCAYLAGILGQELMDHMVHKAGLRAHIITSGTVSQNDIIQF